MNTTILVVASVFAFAGLLLVTSGPSTQAANEAEACLETETSEIDFSMMASPKTGSPCSSEDSYCQTLTCGSREKTCVCTGNPPTCVWSDWSGCGRYTACDSEGYGGHC